MLLQLEMKGWQDLLPTLQDFSNAFLRVSATEDDRLELQLGYPWALGRPDEPKQHVMETEQLHSEGECAYFNLAMLFFAELGSEGSLEVDLLDTLFFLPDHSISYLYKDPRKGLVRAKQRGIAACDTFLKRKVKHRPGVKRDAGEAAAKGQLVSRKFRQVSGDEERSEKSIREDMGYIALLKYKDGSFLRLRESDLRSIFTNPLYANQKFRHNNCTQYIQWLPPEGSEELRIHFLGRHRQHALFDVASKYQLGRGQFGDRGELRRQLLHHDPMLYLFFTAFQICSYLCIHHNRSVEAATFHFVREPEGWSLATIEGARLLQLPQKQFMRANLWKQPKVTFEQTTPLGKENSEKGAEKEMFRVKEQAKTPFYRKVEAHFEQTNAAIRSNMLTFLHQKISNVKRTSDKLLSRSIFHILHPDKPKANLYDLLDSPSHLAGLLSSPKSIRPKQNTRTDKVKKEIFLKKGKRAVQSFVYRGIEPVTAELQEFEQE